MASYGTGRRQNTDMGLAANTTYSYYVKAYDAAGNISAQSNTAQATTLPASGTAMHVADIWTCDSAGNPKTIFIRGNHDDIYWKVKIVDAGGSPVSGVSVTTNAYNARGKAWGTFLWW